MYKCKMAIQFIPIKVLFDVQHTYIIRLSLAIKIKVTVFVNEI